MIMHCFNVDGNKVDVHTDGDDKKVKVEEAMVEIPVEEAVTDISGSKEAVLSMHNPEITVVEAVVGIPDPEKLTAEVSKLIKAAVEIPGSKETLVGIPEPEVIVAGINFNLIDTLCLYKDHV